jgi:hypothetical protein
VVPSILRERMLAPLRFTAHSCQPPSSKTERLKDSTPPTEQPSEPSWRPLGPHRTRTRRRLKGPKAQRLKGHPSREGPIETLVPAALDHSLSLRLPLLRERAPLKRPELTYFGPKIFESPSPSREGPIETRVKHESPDGLEDIRITSPSPSREGRIPRLRSRTALPSPGVTKIRPRPGALPCTRNALVRLRRLVLDVD